MTVPSNLTYPEAAKARTWSKAKSVADKASPRTSRTGLTPALTAAEAAWKKIPFATLDAKRLKITDLAELKAATAAAQLALDAVAAQARVLEKSRDKAKQVKALAPLSKSAKAAAEAAEEALTGLLAELNKLSLSDFKALLPRYMAEASHAQARAEGKLDWKFEPTDAVIKQLAKVSQESTEYKKFADSFEALARKYKFDSYEKVPVRIWTAMLKGMANSGYIAGHVPHEATRERYILGFKGQGGKVVREPMLAQAMKGMSKFTTHAARYLDKVVNEVTKNGSSVWVFWSGTGAKEAAKREAGSGVILEGSVGAWFDKVYNFEPLTGVANIVLWASLSEMYATKAAEYYRKFRFVGYIGPGGTREQSVFQQIEQPTYIKVLDKNKVVAPPPVEWFVVDCVQDPTAKSGWRPTGQPSQRVADRAAAVAGVIQRYGS